MKALGHSQKPIVMTHYPHMLAEDVTVWSKFLDKMGKVISAVWYDVHVGQPVKLPASASELERKVAAGITRKRIDVVCRVGGEFWVVEVKPYANMTALGQAYTYSRLFEMEYEVTGPIRAVVVCDEVDRDMAGPFADLGVRVFVND